MTSNGVTAPSVWDDPTWRRATPLGALERALLARPELRRLAGLHHHGAAGRVLGWSATRWEHTLGVWTLVTAVRPHDVTLRLAALLHDVGHAPYSHALEPLGGIDHHAAFADALQRGALGAWLRARGVDTARIAALVDGSEPSPLRNREGLLHADHLDSFVRGAARRGRVTLDAPAVLAALRLDGPHLAFEPRHADDLAAAIVDEASFHLSPVDVGADAWLGELVRRAFALGTLHPAELNALDDAGLDHRLGAHEATRATFDAVIAGRQRFVAASADADARWQVTKRAAYLPRPLLAGPAASDWEQRWADMLAPLSDARVVRVALTPAPC